ncbi:hypothetical protein [Pelobacter seleniigenes]|uniref:hypothetical protein n=1 Tax=Pelobacter seleniigenes TaxID=407188 RepID=UPI0004A7208D|nr:hypothetical protein [Pelobacter seleniigenes]
MWRKYFLGFIFCLLTTPVWAGTAEISFNDSSFQFLYEYLFQHQNDNADAPPAAPEEALPELFSGHYGLVIANARYLHNDDKDIEMFSGGLDLAGQPFIDNPTLQMRIGAKLYTGKANGKVDFLNIAIALRGEYVIPDTERMGISVGFNYAPKVFSFGDSAHLMETEVRLSYALFPRLNAFISYQNIRCDLVDDERVGVDNSVRLGFSGLF